MTSRALLRVCYLNGAQKVEFEKATAECSFDEFYAFHPGRVAVVKVNGEEIGILAASFTREFWRTTALTQELMWAR